MFLALLLWLVALEILSSQAWFVHAATGIDLLDDKPSSRLEFRQRIKDVNISAFIEMPQITLEPVFMAQSAIPKENLNPDLFKSFKAIDDKAAETNEYDKGFIALDKFSKKVQGDSIAEWVTFAKADYLFKVHAEREEKKYNLPLEEYQDAIRRYPLNSQLPRALYQIGLLQLKMGLYAEVDVTMARALKEYPSSEYVAQYHLLVGESAFFSNDDIRANNEYSYVIEKFPKSEAAADSAFRKAFILFRKGEYSKALEVYQDLEKFHSDRIATLRMKKDPQQIDKYVDRVYYAETLFLNSRYGEASSIYQDLANLFPKHDIAPFVLIRFADCYYHRRKTRAAIAMYQDIIKRFHSNPLAVAVANIHLSSLYFLSNDMRGPRDNETLLQNAFENARKAENEPVSSLALARLANHYLYYQIFPKAQQTLAKYRELYRNTPNQKYIDDQYIKTVELEIYDYYRREDYLAALATYLVIDRKGEAKNFGNTKVLIALADAAKKMSLYEKATQILNRVVYLEKTSEGRQEALLKLIDLLIVEKDLRRASERLRRFNFAYPTSPYGHLYEMYWGELYSSLNNSEQAINHYERALVAAQNKPTARYEIRHLYLKISDHYERQKLPLKAIDSYESYVKAVAEFESSALTQAWVTPRDRHLVKVAKFRIADLYFGMRDYVRALESYRVVVRDVTEEPFLTHARFRQGECFLALDDRAAALKAFQSIEAKDPNNLWARSAKSYIQTVEMEEKYGIRILN